MMPGRDVDGSASRLISIISFWFWVTMPTGQSPVTSSGGCLGRRNHPNAHAGDSAVPGSGDRRAVGMSTMVSTGFYRMAQARPDRIAIIDPDGSTVTFGQLARRVNQVSRALRSRGLVSGDVVAALVRNGH